MVAGFRDFQTGEVLTAANVNDFLMQQSVMKFADATARDTALGTAVGGGNALREGMVAYLDDTDEVLAYDGTAWGSLGLPLGTATPTEGQILAFGTATSTWNPTDQLAGIGSNVVSASDSSDQTTTSGSFVDISNVSVTITPSSATSKVLVICVLTTYSERYEQNSTDSYFQLTDSSNVALQGAEGMRVGSQNTLRVGGAGTFFRIYSPVTLVGLASPATTSAVTYKARYRRGATTAAVLGATNTSKIYAIEVAG